MDRRVARADRRRLHRKWVSAEAACETSFNLKPQAQGYAVDFGLATPAARWPHGTENDVYAGQVDAVTRNNLVSSRNKKRSVTRANAGANIASANKKGGRARLLFFQSLLPVREASDP
jgi:hypothetical protein